MSQTIDQSWLKGITDEETLQAIGQATIDYIRERASNGLGLGGQQLKPAKYKDSYANSPDFKAAGKSQNDVNMKLSGDMLNSIDLALDGNNLLIGIPQDEATRAYAHMTGYEGHPTIPNGKYKRQFFGVTRKEFDQILSKVGGQARPKSSRVANQNEINDIVGTLDTLGDLFRLVE